MKRIIISPSGNLYGSENVLLDYLGTTKLQFHKIYVPENSKLFSHSILCKYKRVCFYDVKVLYLQLFFEILFRNVKVIYCNEGGHSRYLLFLAKIFPRRKFILHIRLLEDTYLNRLPKNTQVNFELIAVSQTIKQQINVSSQIILDGYNFSKLKPFEIKHNGILKIGIIGRITKSKGIQDLVDRYSLFQNSPIEFHFFGDEGIDINGLIEFKNLVNVFFHGFISDKESIYDIIDLVVHLNGFESLGRIFFESLDYGKPFLGVNSGGIGEIAKLIDYNYVYDIESLFDTLLKLSNNQVEINLEILVLAREKAMIVFSQDAYTTSVDKILK